MTSSGGGQTVTLMAFLPAAVRHNEPLDYVFSGE